LAARPRRRWRETSAGIAKSGIARHGASGHTQAGLAGIARPSCGKNPRERIFPRLQSGIRPSCGPGLPGRVRRKSGTCRAPPFELECQGRTATTPSCK
jgi:hypothetical protein